MNPAPRSLTMDALQFSGTVTAAFSHDFKNTLAIIKENTGLLVDLLAMAEKGRPLDPQRLATLAERIGRQVQRADRMTAELNRFAHSADLPEAQTDLGAMLEMAVVLSARPANLKRVGLEAVTAPPLWIATFPFGLQQLLYRCIALLLDRAGSGGRIVLEADDGRPPVALRVIARTAEDRIPAGETAPTPTPEMTGLAHALQIRLDWDAAAGGWRLTWRDVET